MPVTSFPLDLGSRAVHDVLELDLGPRAMGDWSCTRCRAWFPADTSYLVRFGPEARFAFVACPDCADKYAVPGPVTLDLYAASRAHAEDLDPLLAIVTEAERARGRDGNRRLTLRAADVRRVADDLGTTPRVLFHKLEDAELLATG